MPKNVKPIPEGYRTVTPGLTIKDCARAIEFYKKAFGAKELMRSAAPDGKIMHAELKIGDSIIFLADEFPNMGKCFSPQTLKGTTGGLYLYLPDVDSAFKRAVDAGATVNMPLTDMFWGDRYGQVLDPFGHLWSLATHKEDLTPEEIGKRQEKFFAQAAK